MQEFVNSISVGIYVGTWVSVPVNICYDGFKVFGEENVVKCNEIRDLSLFFVVC